MTRLLIVRHAESMHNKANRIQGHKDSGLTKIGIDQAKRLARRLIKYPIDKIYSSDLGRASSTAEEIAALLRQSVFYDPLLREINLGEWEEKTPEEVDRLYDKGYRRWLKKPSGICIPKGEPLARFKKRVTARVTAIARANRQKTVLIVTHGGVITALLSRWLKADFDNLLLNLQLDNTSLTVVEETDKRARLKIINDTSHLTQKQRNEFHAIHKRF